MNENKIKKRSVPEPWNVHSQNRTTQEEEEGLQKSKDKREEEGEGGGGDLERRRRDPAPGGMEWADLGRGKQVTK